MTPPLRKTKAPLEQLSRITATLHANDFLPPETPSDDDNVTFEQLFDVEEIQKFQDEVSDAIGFASLITRPDGSPITRPSRFCRLCSDVIRSTAKGRANCYVSDCVIGAASTTGPRVQRCLSGGLWDAGAAITVGGQHIASWLVGQVRNEAQSEQKIRDYAREIGADEEETVAAFREVPAMSKERFDKTARMVFSLAAKLSENAYQNLQLKRSLKAQIDAEEALRNREAFRKALFATSRTGLFVLDPASLTFIECNETARKQFMGDSSDPVWDMSPIDLSPPEQEGGTPSLEAIRRRFNDALENGSSTFAWRHRRPNGDEWDAEVHLMATHFQGSDYLQAEIYDITERMQAELTLRSVLGAAHDAIVVIDPKGCVTYWNGAAEGMLGYTVEEIVGQNFHQLVVPARYASAHMLGFRRFNKTGQGPVVGQTLELEALRKDGREITVELSLSSVHLSSGWHAVGIMRDITERKKADEKLRLAASVFSNASEGIAIASPDGIVLEANKAATAITGCEREDALGHSCPMLTTATHNGVPLSELWDDIKRAGYWGGEVQNRRRNGAEYTAHMIINAVPDERGDASHYLVIFSDISQIKEQQAQLEKLAYYDALTSLPNRVLLSDRLQQAMRRATKNGKQVSVAYLDLDGFKSINETHGHAVGDELLVAIADNLGENLRNGDTLARLGGDEFAIVLPDLDELHACKPLLQNLLAAVTRPIRVGEETFVVSASVGLTFFPQDDEIDADQLLRQADQAMYQAKLSGKNRTHIFDPQHDRSVRGHYENLDHIRHAFEQRQFVLHYQPKVNMRTGQVIGAEALIRWQHPREGLLPPAAFLPSIESNELGVEIGEWVIKEALRQMTLWHAAGLHVPISVNVGAYQLQQEDFTARLEEILQEHPELNRETLMLEIVETTALEDLAGAHHTIKQCHEMGVRVALDDFGTGYSSLTYLKRLPVQKIKIDQSFVRDMLDDPDDQTILQGIIGLSRGFNREVIAEGVETIEHGEMLIRLGCELAQGYAIARPMPADAFPEWAATWKPNPAWTKE
ncbi:EAL domain-containing protein [Breoghania sp.]|uniref:EAL domain-containing protein n=1 Tax=Breoghania sp. TaxID=2065378 RepID=UPI002AA60BAE|nr:EAL domain-containing protein [Breoghania sp.]